MKKMLSLVLATILILLFLSGCQSKNIPNEIELFMKKGTLSSTGVTLVVKNNSDFYFTYGADYGIEKYENGKWVQLADPENYAVITIAYLLLPYSSSEEIKLDWEWRYGKLSEGEYRIVKNFDKTETFEYNLDSIITSQNLFYYFTI